MARAVGRAKLGTISMAVYLGGLRTVGGTRVKEVLVTIPGRRGGVISENGTGGWEDRTKD
jgi:hypothetical protein